MRRSYPSYRDSGVEWLGAIPDHWKVAPVRRWFAIVNGGTPASNEESYWDGETVWLTPDDLGRNPTAWISTGRRSITDDGVRNSSVRVCPAGSIVMSTRAPIGHLAIASAPVTTNQGCRTLVPDHATDSSFAYYSFVASRRVLQSLGKGTTFMELTPADLGSLRMARPPLDEQRAIAEFLNRETAKIDQLVDKKRSLAERLEEYRQALITRTVTEGLLPAASRAAGLDPHPRPEFSGVEWLGDIPDHWEVRRLGRIGSFFKGGGGTKEDETDEGVPCVRYGDLYTEHQFLITRTRARIAEDVTGNYRELDHGDVLFAGSGETIEEIGKSAANLIEGRAYCGGDVIVFRPAVEVDATYLGYGADCQPSVYQKACMGRGVTVMHIYSRELKQMLIPLPPLEEQQAIAAFLDERLERIDALVSSVEAAIERLEEYRAALIAATVTGKIDVRGEVPADPEKVSA